MQPFFLGKACATLSFLDLGLSFFDISGVSKTAAPVEVPARYYLRAAEVLLRMGVNVPQLLAAARIRIERLDRPDASLPFEQVEILVNEAFRLTGRSDFGIEVGRTLKLGSHSMVGYGMLSSPHADYALRLAARYFKLIMPAFRMRYRASAERAEVSFSPTQPMSHLCLQFHLEALVFATHCELRELLGGRAPPCEIYLSYAEPAHAARYSELDGARCHFGWDVMPGIRMVFSGDFTAYPLAMADPSALRLAEERCKELVRKAVAGGKISDWVAMMLREAGGSMPTQAELAQTLNLSPRTLDRYLQREGESFRALAKRVRHEKACALIEAGELSLTQIAYELGYSDAANFTRAFRREAGRSPSAHRESS
ncbi:AraC-type DNA-binding protein [Solimonas aquatica]|uniref:AraC-type DNA-binding protein n=1 Tax=Solimonas aquatica TaxID=489703 RepID=A0A1H9M2L4_9GAMM|nr:AraC-type DNA-binding protein [Solimonas aquatica]